MVGENDVEEEERGEGGGGEDDIERLSLERRLVRCTLHTL